MKTIAVKIKKPLYGSYVYINGHIVDKAIRIGAKLEIEIPNGKAIVNPIEWKANGKIMKKVFKFPDNPMTLYGGHVLKNNLNGKVIDLEVEKLKERQPKLI